MALAIAAPWSRLHLKVCKEGLIQSLKPSPTWPKLMDSGLAKAQECGERALHA